MCLQINNKCAKAFDNRSRSKNLKPKKSRGVNLTPPPSSRLLGLMYLFYHCSAVAEFWIASITCRTCVYLVGYGNITPVTDGGKVFTIFFALFGIPITILMLSTVGEEMLNCQKYIIRKIETGWLKKQEVSYLEVKSLITAFVIIFFLILVIAILSFKHHKDWTFLDSFYCWFITFTTVGFGDFIPGDGWNDLPKEITFTLYVLLCLCAMSNLLNIAGELASPGIFKIQFDSHADATREVGTKENKDIVNTENAWV